MPLPSPHGLRVVAALGAVYLVWGSTYAALGAMVETVPPWLGAGSRFLLAGGLLLGALALRRGSGALRIDRRQLASCALTGVLLVTLGNGLSTAAAVSAPSAVAALVVATIPLWVVVLRAIGGERIPPRTVTAVAVGLGGIALLMLPGGGGGTGPAPLLVVALAAFCWATGTYAGRRLATPDDVLVGVGVQMLMGGAGSLAVGLAIGEAGALDPGRVSAASAWCWLYLVLAGSVLTFSAYAWLLRNAPVSHVATHAYVNPVVAVLLGWLVLGESISGLTALSASVIVLSVVATLAPARAWPWQRVRLVGSRRPAAGALRTDP